MRIYGAVEDLHVQAPHQGRIPHFKPHGKHIYFNREELERWLLQNPVKTAEQKEREAVDYVVRKRRPR